MNQSLVFKTEKVTGRITRIYAFATELMYLVEGTEKAALIDTGSGIGSLKACVEQLTDKPVIVLVTHGHVDHAMGAAEFENVYMSHEDDYIYEKHGTDAFRRSCFSTVTPPFEAGEEDLIPTMKLSEIKNLTEGDRFDLGGISVEIYACPGHTRGSVVMLIPEERLLITGDACNLFTFVYDDYSTTITEYEESLKALQEKVSGKYDNVLLSHGDGNGYPELIADVIRVCEDIKEGRTDDILFEFLGTTGLVAKAVDPSRGERGNIVYNKDRV
ncbi:MBL fold metallo-hydrolase [Bacillota bacterium LCP21S3_F9]